MKKPLFAKAANNGHYQVMYHTSLSSGVGPDGSSSVGNDRVDTEDRLVEQSVMSGRNAVSTR